MAKNYKNEDTKEYKNNKVTSYDPALSGRARGNVRDEEKKSYTSQSEKKER